MASVTEGDPCAVVQSVSRRMRMLLHVRVSEMAAS